MTRTFFLPSEVATDGDWTHGKSTDDTGATVDVAPGNYDNAWARPAGYAFTNVLDYARFVRFLYAGDTSVLSDASRVAMQTAQVSTKQAGSIDSYGYALFVDTGFHVDASFYRTKMVHHGGDIPGWAADFYLLPETGFGIVVFANADGAHFAKSIVTALQSFGSIPAPEALPSGVAPDPTTFAQLAGTYRDFHDVGPILVSVDAQNTVSVSIPQLDTAKIAYEKVLVPSSIDTFIIGLAGTHQLLTFLPDAATGKYRWLRTRYFVGDNMAGLPATAPPFDAAAFRARLRESL
jgi:CubicO group peptidase (beta-lactamase class C family)